MDGPWTRPWGGGEAPNVGEVPRFLMLDFMVKAYDVHGGHLEKRAAIGRRNTPLNSYVAVSRAQ